MAGHSKAHCCARKPPVTWAALTMRTALATAPWPEDMSATEFNGLKIAPPSALHTGANAASAITRTERPMTASSCPLIAAR